MGDIKILILKNIKDMSPGKYILHIHK